MLPVVATWVELFQTLETFHFPLISEVPVATSGSMPLALQVFSTCLISDQIAQMIGGHPVQVVHWVYRFPELALWLTHLCPWWCPHAILLCYCDHWSFAWVPRFTVLERWCGPTSRWPVQCNRLLLSEEWPSRWPILQHELFVQFLVTSVTFPYEEQIFLTQLMPSTRPQNSTFL